MAADTVGIFFDEPDWAFHNIATQLSRVAGRDVRLLAIARTDWFGRTRVAERLVAQCDTLVFLWRFDLLVYLETVSAEGWERLLSPERPALVTMVYDHIYGSPDELALYGDPFALSDVSATCSERLRADYAASPHLPTLRHVLPDGVDLEAFSPMGPRAPGPLRIGWVGNSAWGASTSSEDVKGKTSILMPALELLRQRGTPFEVRIADKAVRQLPRTEMPGFYRDLDVLVCCSSMEGTPNPVIEAMATGAGVVSTRVGIVPEVFGPRQRDFLLAERSPQALAAALDRLAREPETLAALRAENLARREDLSWESRWPLWQAMLADARAARDGAGGRAVDAALAAYREGSRTRLQRVRRVVTGNRLAYRAYEKLLRRYPAAIRRAKRALVGTRV